jgi:hypothetical protein
MGVFTREQFTEEDGDETAGIFMGDLGRALVIWTCMVAEAKDQVTVADAALAFNTTPEIIREAVDDAYWIGWRGPDDDPTKQILETDGE